MKWTAKRLRLKVNCQPAENATLSHYLKIVMGGIQRGWGMCLQKKEPLVWVGREQGIRLFEIVTNGFSEIATYLRFRHGPDAGGRLTAAQV